MGKRLVGQSREDGVSYLCHLLPGPSAFRKSLEFNCLTREIKNVKEIHNLRILSSSNALRWSKFGLKESQSPQEPVNRAPAYPPLFCAGQANLQNDGKMKGQPCPLTTGAGRYRHISHVKAEHCTPGALF